MNYVTFSICILTFKFLNPVRKIPYTCTAAIDERIAQRPVKSSTQGALDMLTDSAFYNIATKE